jgi:hypothetical protein
MVMRMHQVVDFRRTLPPRRLFWTVYARGTYQNFPQVGDHYFWATPGRYLFRLTRHPLDTSRVRNGVYLLRVVAGDICGNRSSLTERVTVLNGPEAATGAFAVRRDLLPPSAVDVRRRPAGAAALPRRARRPGAATRAAA